MTLAEFARSINITPETARQWKRRGRIVQRDGGWELSRAGCDSVTEHDNVTPVVTPETCAGCDALRVAVEALTARIEALETGAAAASSPARVAGSNYTGPAWSLGEPFYD